MRAPTREEKRLHDRLASTVGCIACLIDGIVNHHVSIHHCDGRTKKGCHQKVLPLCDRHHQTGGEQAPSIHPWKARFEAKYGTQEELMGKCREILEQKGVAWPT